MSGFFFKPFVPDLQNTINCSVFFRKCHKNSYPHSTDFGSFRVISTKNNLNIVGNWDLNEIFKKTDRVRTVKTVKNYSATVEIHTVNRREIVYPYGLYSIDDYKPIYFINSRYFFISHLVTANNHGLTTANHTLKITNLTDEITNLSVRITNLAVEIVSHDAEITNLAAEITNPDAEIANLVIEIVSHNDKIAGHDAKIGNPDAEIGNHADEIANLAVEIKS